MDGFKQFIYPLWSAFPDTRITFDDIIIEGDKVVGIYNLTGTHKVSLWNSSQPINNSEEMV
jgi:predicted ester cyclase